MRVIELVNIDGRPWNEMKRIEWAIEECEVSTYDVLAARRKGNASDKASTGEDVGTVQTNAPATGSCRSEDQRPGRVF